MALDIKFKDNIKSDINAIEALNVIKDYTNLNNYKDVIKLLIFEKQKKIKRKVG